MSPDAERKFESQWPVLERRARAFLIRKKVPRCDQEDLLQEAAVRLLRMWNSIDHTRPLWPLTSTILLNLLRDRSRCAPRDDVVALLPELEAPHDVERAGMARLELDRVRRAMGQLSTSHRTILMQELQWTDGATGSPAEKMLRMRARRKLRSILEKVSGLVVLRSRRLLELGERVFFLRDGAATTASCVICMVLGFGGVVAAPSQLLGEASARPAPSFSGYSAEALSVELTSGNDGVQPGSLLDEAAAEALREKLAGRATVSSDRTRQRSDGATADDDQALLPGLPGGGDDTPIGVPEAETATTPGAEPPTVSPPETGDGPVGQPPAPPAPAPPAPPVNALPSTEEVVEEVDSLL